MLELRADVTASVNFSGFRNIFFSLWSITSKSNFFSQNLIQKQKRFPGFWIEKTLLLSYLSFDGIFLIQSLPEFLNLFGVSLSKRCRCSIWAHLDFHTENKFDEQRIPVHVCVHFRFFFLFYRLLGKPEKLHFAAKNFDAFFSFRNSSIPCSNFELYKTYSVHENKLNCSLEVVTH